jgi:hypothetical protein
MRSSCWCDFESSQKTEDRIIIAVQEEGRLEHFLLGHFNDEIIR